MKTFLLLLSCAILTRLSPDAEAAPTVRFDGTSLVIRDGGKNIRLENALDLPPIKHVAYAAIKRGDDFYLLLGLKEWTRGDPQPRGTCGGGTEQFIRWLHVRGSQIVQRQTGLYDSCYEERTGTVLGWKSGILLWHAHGRRRPAKDGGAEYVGTDFAWTFDSAQPEAGITEHMTDAPDTPSN